MHSNIPENLQKKCLMVFPSIAPLRESTRGVACEFELEALTHSGSDGGRWERGDDDANAMHAQIGNGGEGV